MESCFVDACTVAASGAQSGLIFTHLLRALLAAQCTLSTDIYPPDRTSEVLTNTEFDFIIVGGGTAGSVVASRLSEVNKWKVLLIEEGEDPSLASRIPAFLLTLQQTKEDYSYEVEPNENYCLGMKNNMCRWSKGKALGGSSVINAMLHIHGNDRDYDQWAEMGNKGWSYEEVLPYFRKSENYNSEFAARIGNKYIGTNGPLRVRKFNYSSSIFPDLILQAAREIGIPVLESFNGEENIGYAKSEGTVDNGLRVNVAEAFLSPAKNRHNLYVLKSTKAEKITLSGRKATGVRLRLKNGQVINVTASKEVILSAGTIETAHLLMLSGIGPREHLEEFGIQNEADLPVGKNLQDHIMTFGVQLTFSNKTGETPKPTYLLDSAYEYLIHRKGILLETGSSDLLAFLNVDDSSSKYPNIQFHHVYLKKGSAYHMEFIAKAFDVSDYFKADLMEVIKNENFLLVAVTLLNPKSTGELKLRSADIKDRVKIHSNYFKHPDDIKVMVKSMQVIRDLLKTKELKKIGLKLRHLDIPGCRHTKPDSDEYWECNFRHTGNTVYHAVGTAKMGPAEDPEAVVDSRLKVYGMEKLRVIDASIMPKIPSGNTNSPTVMIAEKGSDMIKEEWLVKDEL